MTAEKKIFIDDLTALLELTEIHALRERIAALKQALRTSSMQTESFVNFPALGREPEVVLSELEQIEEAFTLDRARYYLRRLIKSLTEKRTGKINDINLNRWKDYGDIFTDSLWVLDKRDTSGAHLGWYWGNFIPQIPNQLLRRYTRPGDWVVDPFLGSGTTLIECRRLGRNGIGIELQATVAETARELIEKEPNPHQIWTRIHPADSRKVDFNRILRDLKIDAVQLIILHPPYWDIIKFSEEPGDLSNRESIEDFLEDVRQVVRNAGKHLQKGRFLALVIGDKYAAGEWTPLGFRTMEAVQAQGYLLKSIVVKNFDQTRGKMNQKELWRYRALVGGFYIFKHEYIFLLQKK